MYVMREWPKPNQEAATAKEARSDDVSQSELLSSERGSCLKSLDTPSKRASLQLMSIILLVIELLGLIYLGAPHSRPAA